MDCRYNFLENKSKVISKKPWQEIEKSMDREEMKEFHQEITMV
jgi:hypothetical protein